MQPSQVAAEIAGQLEQAWNDADSAAFARPFTEDADFVNIRGDYFQGRENIARGHQGIFETMHKGSTNRFEVARARAIADTVIVAHLNATLSAPAGPLAGENTAMLTVVLVNTDQGWQITAFQNTLQTR